MASAGPQVAELAQKLYDACIEQFDEDHLFYQQDLLGLGVIPKGDVALLLQCTQSLVDQKLFRLLQDKNDRLAWKIISQEDAEKLQNLSPDESLVFNVIHSSQRDGIWVRNIQKRTNLHKSILDRCLKSLESKGYIKTVHNVKAPTRKTYMLAGLRPAEDVSGGAWFTDGVMDVHFINTVARTIEYLVSKKSWYEVPTERGRSKHLKTATGKVDVKSEHADKTYLPYPANYTGYATVDMITAAVNKSGITAVGLTKDDVAQLVQMLCFDGKLVALRGGKYYKSIKNPAAISESRESQKPPAEGEEIAADRNPAKNNGMTEVPCGSCPSFRLCEPGGAVSPETCEYFDPWMEKNLAF